MTDTKPDLIDMLGEFDAGLFVDKTLAFLKDAAIGVIATGKKGNITIALDLEQIGSTHSVQVKHTLKYTRPTLNGKLTEENTTSTPMYVDNQGYLSVSPWTQEDLFNLPENAIPFNNGDRKNG